jgi:Caspase domain
MRRRDVLALGASLVGTLAARGVLAQPQAALVRGAVVIGVDQAGDLAPLRAAVSGARKFADWLEAEEFEVKRFFDDSGPVAIGDIKSAVKEFVGRATLDQLVVYFAGHGCLINRSERWLLSDAPDDPDAAISFAESYDFAQQAQIGT